MKKVELVSVRSISKMNEHDVWEDMFKIELKVDGKAVTLKNSLKDYSVESFVKSQYPESAHDYTNFIYNYSRTQKVKANIYGDRKHACNR